VVFYALKRSHIFGEEIQKEYLGYDELIVSMKSVNQILIDYAEKL